MKLYLTKKGMAALEELYPGQNLHQLGADEICRMLSCTVDFFITTGGEKHRLIDAATINDAAAEYALLASTDNARLIDFEDAGIAAETERILCAVKGLWPQLTQRPENVILLPTLLFYGLENNILELCETIYCD